MNDRTGTDILNERRDEYRREQFLEAPLPSSAESERVILGAILLDVSLFYEVDSLLAPEDFYSPLHRRIYLAMQTLAYTGKPIDPIFIGEEIKKTGSLDSIGGVASITNLTYGLPHFSDIKDYCVTVKEKAQLRERVKVCNQITSECLAEDDDPTIVLKRTENLFLDSVERQGTTSVSHVKTTTQAVGKFNQKIKEWKSGKETSLPSPFPELNKRLSENGFVLGDLSIVAARPSDGKTTISLNCADFISWHYAPALYFTLEQSEEDIIQKQHCAEGRVENYKIKRELFDSQKQSDLARVERLREAQKRILATRRLYIDDESSSLSQILATAHEFVTKHGVLFIVVDYAQEVFNDLAKKDVTRDRELGQIAGELKRFAKRVTKTKPKVHVMLNVQLKRSTTGKAPTMDEFRESGQFEQICDVAIAPYGEKPKEESVMREMKLKNLKNRKGRVGWEIPIWLHGDWQKFYDKQGYKDDEQAIRASFHDDDEGEF